MRKRSCATRAGTSGSDIVRTTGPSTTSASDVPPVFSSVLNESFPAWCGSPGFSSRLRVSLLQSQGDYADIFVVADAAELGQLHADADILPLARTMCLVPAFDRAIYVTGAPVPPQSRAPRICWRTKTTTTTGSAPRCSRKAPPRAKSRADPDPSNPGGVAPRRHRYLCHGCPKRVLSHDLQDVLTHRAAAASGAHRTVTDQVMESMTSCPH